MLLLCGKERLTSVKCIHKLSIKSFLLCQFTVYMYVYTYALSIQYLGRYIDVEDFPTVTIHGPLGCLQLMLGLSAIFYAYLL